MDQTKDTEKLQILKLILAAQEMARPFAAPPGIPEDRKAALIAAFDATMKDPEFLAEAKKLNLDVDPVSAAALDKLLAELYATPKDVVKKAERGDHEVVISPSSARRAIGHPYSWPSRAVHRADPDSHALPDRLAHHRLRTSRCCAARAASSTTSRCPACCTSRSCAARIRTR